MMKSGQDVCRYSKSLILTQPRTIGRQDMLTTGKSTRSKPLLDVPELPKEPKSGKHLVVDGLGHQEKGMMPSISLISPYKPIICGIADYTYFLTREAPPHSCDVISFDLDNYGVPLSGDQPSATDHVWYGISSRDDFSATSILQGLRPRANQVLWFQHEFGIWRDNARFINMLRDLDIPKVVTLHTLHFQSKETRYGLCSEEYSFLHSLLPHTDAITVFSDGVYQAVTNAFPKHADKVHVLRHGTHLYPRFARMSKAEAKARIHEYLVDQSELDKRSKDNLRRQRVFLDPDTIIIGGTGFITASKGTELLYHVHNVLQQVLPEHKIAAVYTGLLREADSSIDSEFAAEMKAKHNGKGQFFLETYLPGDMLAAMLRALDIYFYWPNNCTQSGIVAHALGAGATIACRDREGVGETVKMAGGLVSADFGQLIFKIAQAILHSKHRAEISERALGYAEKFSWRNQVLRHLELAEQLCLSRIQRPADRKSLATRPKATSMLWHIKADESRSRV